VVNEAYLAMSDISKILHIRVSLNYQAASPNG
jgi:hypothetical protein